MGPRVPPLHPLQRSRPKVGLRECHGCPWLFKEQEEAGGTHPTLVYWAFHQKECLSAKTRPLRATKGGMAGGGGVGNGQNMPS